MPEPSAKDKSPNGNEINFEVERFKVVFEQAEIQREESRLLSIRQMWLAALLAFFGVYFIILSLREFMWAVHYFYYLLIITVGVIFLFIIDLELIRKPLKELEDRKDLLKEKYQRLVEKSN